MGLLLSSFSITLTWCKTSYPCVRVFVVLLCFQLFPGGWLLFPFLHFPGGLGSFCSSPMGSFHSERKWKSDSVKHSAATKAQVLSAGYLCCSWPVWRGATTDWFSAGDVFRLGAELASSQLSVFWCFCATWKATKAGNRHLIYGQIFTVLSISSLVRYAMDEVVRDVEVSTRNKWFLTHYTLKSPQLVNVEAFLE